MKSVWDVRDMLKKSMATQMRKISDDLSSGRAADYAEYKRVVGRIQGLKDGIEAVDEVFRKLDNEGDAD